MAEENAEAEAPPPAPKLTPQGSPNLGTPWSPFHSSLKLPSRVPGAPVRKAPDSPPSLSLSRLPALHTQPSPLVQEFKECFSELDLLIEYKLLYLNCPKGVYILPSGYSLHEWNGVVFARSGPFQSGIFRFTIYMPDGYPRLRPMVRFQSRVFHPYVHATNGVLNLSRGPFPWEPNTHHIWHIVQFIADCFYKKETWEDDEGCGLHQFKEEAKSCAKESLANLYSPSIDGNMIQFKEMKEVEFSKAIATLINGDLPQAPETKPSVLSSVKDQVQQLWDRMINNR